MYRRSFLGMMGAAFATALMGCAQEEEKLATTPQPAGTPTPEVAEKEAPSLPEPPWEYKKLDLDKVADLGYQGYCGKTFDGEELPGAHCCFGSFYAIVKALADEVGSPYEEFLPVASISTVGKGGVVGWGTLCGTLNGAAWAAYLCLPEEEADKVVNELYAWYQVEELPKYKPPKAMKAELDPMPSSVANSPLCHASVTNWCEVSGYKAFSPERSERCARLTADVARKAVELINAMHDGTFAYVYYEMDDDLNTCGSCHSNKGSLIENTRGKMHCSSCHTESGAKNIEDVSGHPKV
ncbi:C_GCAxxG_C_C family protein [Geoglobus acetivorans]|nr:C_GCAxxG_C_C family protein [Geoglobus acetivorans]